MDAVEGDRRVHPCVPSFPTMTIRRLAITAATACAALGACSSAARRAAVRPIAEPGTYTVRATAGDVELKGFMHVIGDTVALTFDRTTCVRDPVDVSNVTLKYRCDPYGDLSDIVFYIDRRDPVQASRWNATTLDRTTRRTCTSTSIVGAREVCNYQDVPTMVTKSVYGQLVVSREVASAR